MESLLSIQPLPPLTFYSFFKSPSSDSDTLHPFPPSCWSRDFIKTKFSKTNRTTARWSSMLISVGFLKCSIIPTPFRIAENTLRLCAALCRPSGPIDVALLNQHATCAYRVLPPKSRHSKHEISQHYFDTYLEPNFYTPGSTGMSQLFLKNFRCWFLNTIFCF